MDGSLSPMAKPQEPMEEAYSKAVPAGTEETEPVLRASQRVGPPAAVPTASHTGMGKIMFQIRLLLWKRYRELAKQPSEFAKYFAPPILFFAFICLLYGAFTPPVFTDGGIDYFLVPFAFWVFVQKTVVIIMYEKQQKLQESMRMMGLSDTAYWVSYFISEGVVIGFVQSLICALMSLYPPINNGASFGTSFALYFTFSLSATTFSFFLCSFFDTPQTAGQATLGIMLGFYVIFMAFTINLKHKSVQVACCLAPPLALQLGAASFLRSYRYDGGLTTGNISLMMFADIFIYSILAWYFSQVWPSKVGVAKPWYFLFTASYWRDTSNRQVVRPMREVPLVEAVGSDAEATKSVPTETPDEAVLGQPTVQIRKLKKTFGAQVAVNEISFDMFENQIFALLGHNGAGKTTTISMLTGLDAPDFFSNSDASIYDKSILNDMETIRKSMGVCPQHDVLFEHLSVREHILFFSQLKGFPLQRAEEEAADLAPLFHLENRLDHTGGELSGGQKRKLSVAIAICGGSKFIVLDEPTAGMDPLARRELWDLLASLRPNRTMLLTTHYMDEADVLGDRVAIMSLGEIQCIGTTQFLKSTFGAGYKLIFEKSSSQSKQQLDTLIDFVCTQVKGARPVSEEGADDQVIFELPFDSAPQFGDFFTKLEEDLKPYGVDSFGISITSLEDVFLKVGEDHTVVPQEFSATGIGSATSFNPNILSQTLGIAGRKLRIATNDFITIPLMGLPAVVGIVAAILYERQVISSSAFTNNLITAGLYMAGYLGAPGLIAEFLVRERTDKLRNVLTVMGCDFTAYWLGTLIADYIIMSVPMIIIWITWGSVNLGDFINSKDGLPFAIFIVFTLQIIAFSYISSYIFGSPKSCMAFMPIFIIGLLIAPNVFILLVTLVFGVGLKLFTLSTPAQGGIMLWGFMILSPHGALFTALLDTVIDMADYVQNFPPYEATISFMLVESVLYLGLAYYIDSQSVIKLTPQVDEYFNEAVLDSLDEDVAAEREKTLSPDPATGTHYPLSINRLRKVFPPKRKGASALEAVQDVAFSVSAGEIFGLLGANGAGKTTTLSMLTRHLIPTSGDAFISDHSILSDFSKGSTNLGVVTQNNALWDLLSVESHLYLFARLRGVSEDVIKSVVDSTIDQLELTPHRHKLSMRLSGGMKRKLCVAIALIGDPKVVLLDEPSAGLDPVSRRNLWNVILKTMSNRAVVLTTHSMEEAEALCQRIGIMVKGQLRVLGTKQHLKSKFGSGYELVVKLKAATGTLDADTQVSQLSAHVTGLFPSAEVINDNAGLVTYRVPGQEMKMGRAFKGFESAKAALGIEDYSIAQPTLEQVFIRTVNDHSEPAPIAKGSLSLSMENGVIFNQVTGGVVAGNPEMEFVAETNYCGCTVFVMRALVGSFCALSVLLLALTIATGTEEIFGFFCIALVICCVMLIIYVCPCCKKPTGLDE